MEATDKGQRKEREPGADSREMYRFVLAMTILILFGLLLMTTMAGGYTDPTVLAGMFSGWIVAIIGFYFMDEVSARSLSQETKRATEGQFESAYVAQEKSLKEKDTVITELKSQLAALSNSFDNMKKQRDQMFTEQNQTIMKLTEEVEERRKFAMQFKDVLAELGPRLESMKEG